VCPNRPQTLITGILRDERIGLFAPEMPIM